MQRIVPPDTDGASIAAATSTVQLRATMRWLSPRW
jgi:hypothetical protein